ncbi:MAG: electron transporter RnfB, partial [Lentisphaeria bacterium]|nr:electron transporter RnfB [Lentisphaeria bacterium]
MTSAVIVLVCMGLLLGLVIGVVAHLFGAEPDAKLEAVEELLPGANCGGCGYAGCAAFAKALVKEETTP